MEIVASILFLNVEGTCYFIYIYISISIGTNTESRNSNDLEISRMFDDNFQNVEASVVSTC